MICPNCGQENSDKATRCSACGFALEPTEPRDPTPDLDATRPVVPGTQPLPADRQPEEAPRPDDVSFRTFFRLKARKAEAFLQAHRRLVALVAVLALAGILAVVTGLHALGSVPSNEELEADISQRVGPVTYAAGAYGTDEEIGSYHVVITKKEPAQTPQGRSATLGASAYDVDAEIHYVGNAVEIVRDVGGTYAREDGTWTLQGALADYGTSYSARAGVDQDKVLANASAIMAEAAKGWTGDGSLADAYQKADFTVVANEFDASPEDDTSTDDVTLHAVRTGEFSSMKTDVVAHFAFLDGTWQLRSADAPDDALTPRYDQLCGTWVGTFVTTSSTKGTCYGASATPLSVTIQSVGDSSGARSQVTGTVTGLAHFHEPPEQTEDSDAGDQALDQVAFTGTIQAAHSDQTGADLNIDCRVPDSAGGSVEFTLGFGPEDDPTGAVALVRTSHEYTEKILLLVPRQTTVTYTDTYRLARQ